MGTFKDKKGRVIKANDIIYNIYNNPTKEKIIEVDGLLCFDDGTVLNNRYQTDKYWEIVTE